TVVSPQTVLFAAGVTSRSVTVNTTSDTKVEADETFTPTQGGLNAGGRAVTISGTNDSATGTITNDDSAVFSIANSSATEGNGVAFGRSPCRDGESATSVAVTTNDGRATMANNDYTAVSSQTVTLAAGVTSKCDTVNTTTA